MAYSVKEKAEYVGTFRWMEIQLMETLARWVPTTPEMEIKILFGRHVWDCAQHADQLGKRAFELRAPLHYTLPAMPECQSLLRGIGALNSTADRVGAFYGILCQAMVRLYQDYIAGTDLLLDEPTVRLLQGAVRDYQRMAVERDRLAGEFHRSDPATQLSEWFARGRALTRCVAHGPGNHRARGTAA